VRTHIRSALAFILVLTFQLGWPRAAHCRPNVVVVMTDDLSVGEFEAALAARILPNIQQHIIDAGTTFSNSFVSSALCCPSRAALLTGQHAHNNGVLDNHLPTGGATKIADAHTLPVWLRAAGYRTGYVGKYLNGYGANETFSPKDNPTYVPPGWHDWQGLIDPTTYKFYNFKINDNGNVVTYGSGPSDYQTDVLRQRSLAFVAESEAVDSKPFFLVIATLAPHLELTVFGPGCPTSIYFPRTIRPAPRHQGTLAPGVTLIHGPAYNEADMSDKPGFLAGRAAFTPLDEACMGAFWRARLESLMAVDDLVGALVDDLAVKGELSDTVLVFTSDNGFYFGEHRLNGKVIGYEEGLRVPLIIRAPGYQAGQATLRLVQNVDLSPTILELGQATATIAQDGRSLLPLLEDPGANPWRRRVFGEFLGTAVGRTFTMARTGPDDVTAPDASYISWSGGAVEYYDLTTDPAQLVSRHTDPGTATQRAYLAGLINSFKLCTGPLCATLEN
jgi:arylsulfatase A-like enzyme